MGANTPKISKKRAIDFLKQYPYLLGHMVGFTKLSERHNEWIKEMIRAEEDHTLQAHRGSYKTTCVSIALAVLLVIEPKKRILFMRKTDSDVKEVLMQVQKILLSEPMRTLSWSIYGSEVMLTARSYNTVNTNANADVKGTPQLFGTGTNSSLTGKHFDIIFTDDIVNVNDRISKAEREHTKLIYQELQNVKNKDGRIFNTGTLWHKEDAFSLMPKAEQYDCYHTGILSKAEISEIKEKMTPALFACNYELKIIADDDVIFDNPQTGYDMALAEQGVSHVDAAYGGEDWTAFTVCRKFDGKYYVYGRCWRKHVDDVLDEIVKLHNSLNCGIMYCEDNGDKGYLAKAMRQKGLRAIAYHEGQNKFLKITSYLKSEWKNVCFVAGTDEEYINQICDYNENAEHDDCPDSLASIIRKLWQRAESGNNNSTKRTIFI
ncbi:hypothetical protein IJI69_00435 [Candidatus Saccharibacteria bacterium]|nr:hypothetical protein [Candidatus Saccharibacteria bacterium]MBQ6127156.1 hypothetical protein [Candidatus Saccharibacteria bacterium]